MGNCGCGDFHADVKFRGPGDSWYILQFYPSCDYCDNPLGIIVYKMSDVELKSWAANKMSETKINLEGSFFPLLHTHYLKNQMIKWIEENDPEGDQYEPLGAIEDSLDNTFKEAVFETLENYKKENHSPWVKTGSGSNLTA